MLTHLATIEFPNIDPIIFQLGPLAVRWYGVAYLLGFLFAYLALLRLIKLERLLISQQDLGDLMSWLVAGVMAGGRIGWWLFYHRANGASEPWYELIAVWHGGMSFHGGLIGVVLALVMWTRKRSVRFWNVADALALVAPIGLLFGRVANFINAELVGRPTTIRWGMIFPGDTVPRHPSQLYEALFEGPILLIILWVFFRFHQKSNGQIAALFLIYYGTFRFMIEFTRQPDPQLGFIAFHWLTMGQLLSALVTIFGLVFWLKSLLAQNLLSPPKVSHTPEGI